MVVAWVRGVWKRLIGIFTIMADAKLGLVAAGVAFFSLFAVFPGIAAVIALFGYFADPRVVLGQIRTMQQMLPADAYDVIQTQVQALIKANVSTLGWTSTVSFATAIWSTRAGVASLLEGVSAAHGCPPRGTVAYYLDSILMTLAMVLVTVVALGLAVGVPILLRLIPVEKVSADVANLVTWSVSVLVVIFGIALAFRFGPNRRRRTRWLSPGLFLAVATWALVSVGFSIYLADFGNYNRIYGSIGAVIALMMWLYLAAYAILFGAALNAELEDSHGDGPLHKATRPERHDIPVPPPEEPGDQ